MTKLSWGIIGTGAIAKTFAKGIAGSKTGKLVAVGSRTRESADKFADQFNVPNRHDNYDALLADPQVQAVYIATPHPTHADIAIRAAKAKKHILVEKPMALNVHEASTIIEAAIANDVFLMEAFMYRCHPQTIKLMELIQSKAIGDVRVIHATFSFHWPIPFNPNHRLTENALAGGGILDVGGYPVSMARLIAGAEPIEVKAVGHLGETGIDEWTVAIAKFPGDILAQLSTGIQLNQENVVRVYGTEGSILVPEPWVPARDGGSTKIILTRRGKPAEEIVVDSPEGLYSIEADTVAANIERRQAPQMSWDDSLGNMQMLDAWRASLNFLYDSEKPQNLAPKKLSSRVDNNMKYGQIDGLDKKISRVVMGVDNQTTMPHAATMFDDFFERGGNVFDTAFVYGPLKSQIFGAWIKNRGVRNDIALILKGAHTPFCDPKNLTDQLNQSLDQLQTDHADIYMMHRDNPEIGVGEFIDVLNEHVSAGRIKIFGGSNWSIARVQEANDYAKSKNLRGFSVVSNNFSLARMVDPVWAGCISASDADSRAWFEKNQMPLFAWSSQSRGFFLPGRAAPDKREDAELVRCWYAEDNFKRLERVNEMAKKRNVLPINIALAYVLNQPFPTFPLIGPRRLSETRTSLAALDIELSPEELRWLNLES